MRYIIENASADDTDRYDDEYPSGNWECVASGNNLEELMHEFLRALNDECVSIENGWVRMVENPDVTEVITA
jgi:hypothetical protein